MYYVYVHIFPNGKAYVGITRQTPEERWSNGDGYKAQPVYKYIKKYGWDNIEHIILESGLNEVEAAEKETYYINKYDSYKNGYNYTMGGDMGSELVAEFEYNGKIYNSKELASLSKVKGLTYHDITTRVNHHKWSIEEALTKPKAPRGKKFLYNGNLYTAKELASMSNVKGITPEHILSRMVSGFTVERAMTQPLNVKKQPRGIGTTFIEHDGKKYNSYDLELMSNVDGLSGHTILNRIRRGWTFEDAISKPTKKTNQLFEYNGKMYTSKELAAMSPYDNISHHDITDRINSNHWSVYDAIYKPKRKFKSTRNQD